MYKFKHVKIDSLIGITGSISIDILDYVVKQNLDVRKIKRLKKALGFESIRILDKPNTVSDMCIHGVEELCVKNNLDLNLIDCLIYVTQSPDYLVPATSYRIQDKLNLRDNVLLMDLVQGCSGWVYGLFYASSLIESKICKNVLLCNGDLSFYQDFPVTNNNDLSRLFLGDGASVTLLSYSKDNVDSSYSFFGDGSKRDVIINESTGCRFFRSTDDYNKAAPTFSMNGPLFADFALNLVPKEVTMLLSNNNYSFSDVSYLLLHQSNKTLLNSIASMLDLDENYVPFLAKNIGNTSSASIPLVLSDNFEKLPKIFSFNKTLLCGVGVGLTCATAIVDFTQTKILHRVQI